MELPSRPHYPPAQREGGRSSEAQIRQEGSRFGATHAANRAVLGRNTAHSGTKTLVVWGLGGAGKTQLVLDYVQQHRDQYKATFWIEAERKESLERDFVRLYQTLFGLYTSAGQETAISVEDAVARVKSWFAGQRGRWLIVFDGADTIEDEKADGYINIKHFIPSTAALDVIIKSRSSTAKDMTRLEGVQVGEMEAGQAAELFQKYARIYYNGVSTKDKVLCIVKELRCLALAITLAATYVGRTPRLQSNIKAYLSEYKERRRELLQRKPESLVHQYSESVLTTWETSYAAVAGQCAEASMLMTILSFLSFDDIYLKLFYTNIEANSEEQIKYSLVWWKAEQQGYAMHKLVHAWGYDRLGAEEQSKYSKAAFQLVIEAIEGCSREPEDKLRLVPHVMGSFAALTTAHDIDGTTEDIINEIEGVVFFIKDLERWAETLLIEEYVLQARCRLLGEEHPDTILTIGNVAITLREQGQLEKAVHMQKKVLEKIMQIVGEDHPNTILATGNLANMLRDQGQLEEAAKMEREVLEKRRRMLGEDHPDTISAMVNLAITLGDQVQLDDVAKMEEEVLEKRRRILGEDDPHTILAMSNLAITLVRQGQLDEAAKIEKEVLEKRRRIFGEEHLSTISAKINLSITLRRLNLQGQENS
ncbi:hypothetical protein COCCADRAFT_31470 [Bipolaris zeicola 26-R-13]|uniref:NB-ARC domain-containing protein n=1 Tax=Cochliobolus carbonum (strain 26-R-13) TaxID=930089 RepID=W6XNP6_COCC2|nr:uncharacterized protein COCCADRAFT_31470 [Bipolaris zeicola 26-R-13]EUC26875.1 hypothetical protein COCCADRAFT_31470 [Bipolaris zeicola 26-R-13]